MKLSHVIKDSAFILVLLNSLWFFFLTINHGILLCQLWNWREGTPFYGVLFFPAGLFVCCLREERLCSMHPPLLGATGLNPFSPLFNIYHWVKSSPDLGFSIISMLMVSSYIFQLQATVEVLSKCLEIGGVCMETREIGEKLSPTQFTRPSGHVCQCYLELKIFHP